MNLYIRLFILFIRLWFEKPIKDILQSCHDDFTVLPTDLDLNGHMNNGRYLTIMDLGRMDFLLRTGLFKLMRKQKCFPVLGTVKIRYRIQLKLWQKYRLQTRVVCWDDKWIFMEQRFIIKSGIKSGAIAAIALIKGGFYDAKTKTTVPTADLLASLNMQTDSPDFPDYIIKWINAEDALRALTPRRSKNEKL